jgi:hypothetical protein
MANAQLDSTHAPVHTGSGNVDIGSIGVVPSEWGINVGSYGTWPGGFLGSQWQNFADAIGIGCAGEVLASGTGSVTITPLSSSPPPIPGGGVGSGTIT